MGDRHRPSRDDSNSDTTDSDDEGTALTVSEARGMLRDVLTLCERQPHKKQLAEARARAQGDPRAAMLSVVPMVVEVAEEALARRAKNKQQAMPHHAAPKRHEQRPPGALSGPAPTAEPLLTVLLREAQFLVGADSSGYMKKDMAALRRLLSPP